MAEAAAKCRQPVGAMGERNGFEQFITGAGFVEEDVGAGSRG